MRDHLQRPFPRFGNIKANLGYRRFTRRSFPAVNSEWRLICAAHNTIDLRAAGVPLVELHSLTRWLKPRLLGGNKFAFEVVPRGRGWVLGDILWSYMLRKREGGGEVTKEVLSFFAESEDPHDQVAGSLLMKPRETPLVFFWLCSGTLIFNRLFTGEPLPDANKPSLSVLVSRRRPPGSSGSSPAAAEWTWSAMRYSAFCS